MRLGCRSFTAGDAVVVGGFLDSFRHSLAYSPVEDGRDYVIGMEFVGPYYVGDRMGGSELHVLRYTRSTAI